MSLFNIDAQACEGCGICVAICPLGIIEMKEKRTPPTPTKGAARFCIKCGHCVAVCPHGAISLAVMRSTDCQPVRRDLLPSLEQLEAVIRARRSIRVYKDKPVGREQFTRLLDIVRYAPTGKNTQHLHWLVIEGQDKLKPLVEKCIDWMRDTVERKDPMALAFGMKMVIKEWEKGGDPVLRNAPALVVVHAPKEYAGGFADSTVALTTFELTAFTAGLGTCWAGFFQIGATQWPDLREALGLPDGHVSCGAMMVGYPKFRYQRVPERKELRITWR